MNKQKVTSREYKVMLAASRFIGNEQQLISKAGSFWTDLKEANYPHKGYVKGKLDAIRHRRTIRFYDTSDLRLNLNHYVFRERIDVGPGEREVTLKFRHPDRYIAQDRNMDAMRKGKGKSKFEEDIKPKFRSLYSFSTKQRLPSSKNLKRLKDLVALYPDLENKLDEYEKDKSIAVVAGFTAYEAVLTGGKIRICADPKLDVSCAVIVWYHDDQSDNKPVVVEFSLNYQNKQENYTRKMAELPYKIFELLQDDLSSWTRPASITKTKYVYNLAKSKISVPSVFRVV